MNCLEKAKYFIWILVVSFGAFLYGVDEEISLKALMVTLLFFLYYVVTIRNGMELEVKSYVFLFLTAVFTSTIWNSEYVASKELHYIGGLLVILCGTELITKESIRFLVISIGTTVLLIIHFGLEELPVIGLEGFGPKLIALFFFAPLVYLSRKGLQSEWERWIHLAVVMIHGAYVVLVTTHTYWILSEVFYLAGCFMLYGKKEELKKEPPMLWILIGVCGLGLTMLRGDNVNYYCGGIWNMMQRIVGVL